MHKVTRMLSESIARIEKLIYGAKAQPSRFVIAHHHQTDQTGIDAATQRYSNNQSAQLNCFRSRSYRPCCKVSLVRHHEIYSKRKGESPFRHHRKLKYDKIFLDCRRSIQCTDVKSGLIPKRWRVYVLQRSNWILND